MRRKLIAAVTAIALGMTMTTTGAMAFGHGGGGGGGQAAVEAATLAVEVATSAASGWRPFRRHGNARRLRRRAISVEAILAASPAAEASVMALPATDLQVTGGVATVMLEATVVTVATVATVATVVMTTAGSVCWV